MVIVGRFDDCARIGAVERLTIEPHHYDSVTARRLYRPAPAGFGHRVLLYVVDEGSHLWKANARWNANARLGFRP